MGNCDMAKILLEARADLNVITSDGSTINDIVILEGSKQMKAIFKEYSK